MNKQIIFFTFIIFIQLTNATIPLHLIDGEWILSGMHVEKGTLNTTHIENQHITTHQTNNKLDITNESSKSRYYLYSINATSFLFENNGTSNDSPHLEYPFIFTINFHNNVFYSSFRARQDTWVDIVITNKGTTITLIIYSPVYTTILVANKKIEDTRSILKRYYLLFLCVLYVIVFIIPKYIRKGVDKLKRKVKTK